ncbi:MAG: hypothetical protein JXB29_13175 [Sedimentisphaerales bacterium]|nr:hypothetical protein [Sedimentisphaerales bacterium]
MWNPKGKRKALYEVIAKGRLRVPRYEKVPVAPQVDETKRDDPVKSKTNDKIISEGVDWRKRPRIIQLNAGRVEVSVPYQVAIAIGLGLVLLMLVFFRLGQNLGRDRVISQKGTSGSEAMSELAAAQQTRYTRSIALSNTDKTQIAATAANHIVIQAFRRRADLEPVREYFAQFDIRTEIRKIERWYYLITKDTYENPGKPGTDGYLVKQRIIQLGANYKAPQGYETFAPNFFKDAYSKRF